MCVGLYLNHCVFVFAATGCQRVAGFLVFLLFDNEFALHLLHVCVVSFCNVAAATSRRPPYPSGCHDQLSHSAGLTVG